MQRIPDFNPTCRVRGHQNACNKSATLLSEGGGHVDHTHRCLRCGDFTRIDREELDPMVEAYLRMALPEITTSTTVDIDFVPRAGFH